MSFLKFLFLAVFSFLLGLGLLLFCVFWPAPAHAEDIVLIFDSGHGGPKEGGCEDWRAYGTNQRIPEDAYVYDIAKRAEALALQKGWKVFFTVSPLKNQDVNDADGKTNIMAPRRDMVLNYGDEKQAIDPGKKGLKKRAETAKRFAPKGRQFFISFHFDCAGLTKSGTKIYTVYERESLDFATFLIFKFKQNGLEFNKNGSRSPMLDFKNTYVVLRYNDIKPRVLVEFGNFYSDRDRALLLSKDGRQKYAEILIEAIEEYLTLNSKRK